MNHPFARKWNQDRYEHLSGYVAKQIKRSNVLRSRRTPNAATMPDLTAIQIGSAKRMNAAILFFDLQDFTATTSHISSSDTLMILNTATTLVMNVVRMWNGKVEKHTGDGVMAIIGTETLDSSLIARDAIEVAQTIKFLMRTDVFPQLIAQALPPLNFRIGIEMGELLISRIGLPSMNFLTAVGSAANRASKLESLAESNGVAIGENLASNLHPYLHQFIRVGDSLKWDWYKGDGMTRYNYYHYDYEWGDPKEATREWVRIKRQILNAS